MSAARVTMTTAIALMLALWTSVARAQVRDAATADALFRQARALMKKGDFAAACPKLADSQRLDPAAGTLINLGDCLAKVGKLADAHQALRDALDLLPPDDKRIDPVKRELLSLERRVPRLTVKLAAGAPDGTTVTRDDVVLGPGSLGTALPVNPGEHWVVVAAPERSSRRTKVLLAEGAERTIEVAVGDTVANSTHSAEVAASSRDAKHRVHGDDEAAKGSSQQTWGYAVGAVGVVGLGVAGFFALQANSKESQAKDAGCTASSCPTENGKRFSDDADGARGTANVFLAGGIIGVVSGLVLVMTAPAGRPSTARVSLSPVVASAYAGAQFGGVW